MAEHWDAGTYDRVSNPQAEWGAKVLDRLHLAGDELVLDAGCGTGRVTERLLERLPRGHVIALDRSPAMAALARRRLPSDRACVIVADLGAPLPIGDARLDAVVSTATFHWVSDHDALFAGLARILRPGGQLVAQCGGAGNLASVRGVLGGIGDDWREPWTYATPAPTEQRLAAAGFTGIECWLNDETTPFASWEELRAFLETVVLWPYLERLPGSEREAFTDHVVGRLPAPTLDYVRLNILARRGFGG